jgi:hypothetical protein
MAQGRGEGGFNKNKNLMCTMKHFLTGAALLGSLVFFTNCKDDDDGSPDATGAVQFEITDGPIDDANITGAFVTISAIEVDGETLNLASNQTIDLMAYQSGQTKILGTMDLETDTYNEVKLVLDCGADTSGNSPGCYVLTKDGTKHNLLVGSNSTLDLEVETGSFEVMDSATTQVVLDFDLRKAIRYQDNPQNDDSFDFVTEDELEDAVRIVSKANAGKIEGSVADNLGVAGDRIVVFAYEKGAFDKTEEIKGQGASEIQFKNAVASTSADAQGDFTLAFLEEGDYEIHAFAYEDSNSDGEMELLGELSLDLVGSTGLDLNDINIGGNGTVTVTLLVTGLLP